MQTRNRTKKATPEDIAEFWSNYVNNVDYTMQQAVVEAHIPLNDMLDTDFYMWAEAMQAQKPEEAGHGTSLGAQIEQSLKGTKATYGNT